MQPATDKFKLHVCTLLVTCLLIAIKSYEVINVSYVRLGGWVGGGNVLRNFISQFTNIVGKK